MCKSVIYAYVSHESVVSLEAQPRCNQDECDTLGTYRISNISNLLPPEKHILIGQFIDCSRAEMHLYKWYRSNIHSQLSHRNQWGKCCKGHRGYIVTALLGN